MGAGSLHRLVDEGLTDFGMISFSVLGRKPTLPGRRFLKITRSEPHPALRKKSRRYFSNVVKRP
jgi:hypothetical protein